MCTLCKYCCYTNTTEKKSPFFILVEASTKIMSQFEHINVERLFLLFSGLSFYKRGHGLQS